MKISIMVSRLAVCLALLMSAGIGRAVASFQHKAENRVIYEVFVRNFSPAGNLKGVEAQIPRLKELGVDVVWLMPIYKLGDTGKWGTYSSPYAVKDYRAIDPDNGTEQDLRDLVKTIHDNGMEIWFDWVANHTSMDNVWVSSHPEFYKWSGGQIEHPFGWNDVYQLNNDNTAMQDEMIRCMQYWVDNFDIDGYRCDYASGPSPELWRKASQRVLKNGKRVAWLAEDDSRPELVSNGWFDYNYAWGFHDRLLDQVRGINIYNLKNECSALHNDAAYRGRSRMVYLSNHDVVQDKGGTEDKLFGRYLRPLTVLQFTVYGMPLIYNGQEIQYKSGSVSLAEKTPIDWSRPDTEMNSLIKTLCTLKHTQPALNTGTESGTLINFEASDQMVYAYERRRGSEHVVVMLNFGDNATTFRLTGDLPGINGEDVFSEHKARLKSGESFTLPALGYAVYVASEGDLPEPENPEPVEPEDPTPSSTPAIYVADHTGWSSLYVYGWDDNLPELFGGWPGTGGRSVTVGSTQYVRFDFPSDKNGEYNLIFNNGHGTQFDGPKVTAGEDLYISITADSYEMLTPPASSYNIYVLDRTGWDELYLYAYRDEAPSLFGAWPGHKITDTETLNGTTYRVIRGVTDDGGEHSFIFNDNRGTQFDVEGTHRIDHNIFLEAAPKGITTAVSVIADDETPAEYYDLHGRRVLNPDRGGLYIVREGTKVRKIIR